MRTRYIEPPESEHKYRELSRRAQELRIPIMECFLQIDLIVGGKVIKSTKQRSHSYVRNAYNWALAQIACKGSDDTTFGAGHINLKNSAGTVVGGSDGVLGLGNSPVEDSGYGVIGAAGSVINGIVVGSGSNAESFEDYALQTLITSGAGAGQLSYALSEVPAAAYVAGTLTWTVAHVRYLNNNSGGDVSVNEVGIIATMYPGGSINRCMISRDKLGATVTVPNTGQIKVTYTFTMVFPG